jgi:hypothetical protein
MFHPYQWRKKYEKNPSDNDKTKYVELKGQQERIRGAKIVCLLAIISGFLAVVWFGSSPTPSSPPLPLVSSAGNTQEDWERETNCWRERGEGVERSLIIRRRESLVLHKSINTLLLNFGFH